MTSAPSAPSPSPLARYRRVLAEVRAERGEACECCKAPTRSAHHIIGVGLLGIASELVYDPANLLLVCNDCHSLFHPGRRAYPWAKAGQVRGQALARGKL